MIYLDHAATTRLDTDALAAMMPFLQGAFGNPSASYFFGQEAKSALENARKTVAACIGASPSEIVFTSGGTESDHFALTGVMLHAKNGRLITQQTEHHAVLRTTAFLEDTGFDTKVLPVDAEGMLLPKTLKKAMTRDTRLVSVMTVNNEIGTVQPIKALAKTAHENGALFHTDAVQAIGHLPVNVKEMGVDLLSASAHKFGGPKGIGFLYIKEGTPMIPLLRGGAQEMGWRGGTENVAFAVGMAEALQKRCAHMEKENTYILHLESIFLEVFRTSGVIFYRNGGKCGARGICSLSFPGVDGEALLHQLDLADICISTGAACNSREQEISHVLRAIGLDDKTARGTVRISISHENTEEEIITAAKAIEKAVKNFEKR